MRGRSSVPSKDALICAGPCASTFGTYPLISRKSKAPLRRNPTVRRPANCTEPAICKLVSAPRSVTGRVSRLSVFARAANLSRLVMNYPNVRVVDTGRVDFQWMKQKHGIDTFNLCDYATTLK